MYDTLSMISLNVSMSANVNKLRMISLDYVMVMYDISPCVNVSNKRALNQTLCVISLDYVMVMYDNSGLCYGYV